MLNGDQFGIGRMELDEILAKVDVGAVAREAKKIDAKAPYDTFSFSFATREQHLGVTIEGLKIFDNQDKNILYKD
jgi:hypothetical protein